MVRNRSLNSYERTYRILRRLDYNISKEGVISVNGSGSLGRVMADGKLEIFSNSMEKYKLALIDQAEQDGLKSSLANMVIS